MATTGRTVAADSVEERLTATLREAEFLHVVSHADGDAVAAAGLVATALPDDAPVQVSTVRTDAEANRRLENSTATTVAIGFADRGDESIDTDSNALLAYEVATTFGDPDPVLASAGAMAAGTPPRGPAMDAAADLGVERRPGVGIPTADLGDGLAHSTLFHADLSGDEGRAGAFLAELDLPATLTEGDHRRLASALAMRATESAPSRAVTALEAALRPHEIPAGPFETVEGFADVLSGVARADPGLAVALAMDGADAATVLDAWREHAVATHETLRRADRRRHQGFVALDVGAVDPWDVARLARDYRSGERAVLAVGRDSVALATTDADARGLLSGLDAVGGVGGRSTLAAATDVDPARVEDQLVEVR
ncbi:MAG: hypothetical protein ABEJ77_04255 [Halanaeroarchaeum sp.]